MCLIQSIGVITTHMCRSFRRTEYVRLISARGNILELTFEIYRLENDFYYGHSYIARHDERIRFNGQTNDRCAADRELEIRETQKVGVISAKGKRGTC